MANHKSAIKRARQSERRHLHNKHFMTLMRNQLRAARSQIAGDDQTGVAETLKTTTSVIHKLVEKGLIHKNTGSRYISRMMAQAHKKNAAAQTQTASVS